MERITKHLKVRDAKMKKMIIAVLLISLMTIVVACGGTKTPAATVSSEVTVAPATAAPATVAPATPAPKEETTFEKAKRQGYVTIGFANENPYAFATADGKTTGEAVEVARVVLNKLGIKEMNGVVTEFGSLIPGLKAKRFDIITAGMFVTPKRALEVAFANPEYSIGEAIAVKKGNPLNLHSYEDIKNNPKAKIAVMGGAIEAEYLKKIGVSTKQIVITTDNPAAFASLKAGRVDVITMTGPSLEAIIKAANDTSLERIMDFKQPVIDGKDVRGYGAAVFRKEDNDFREAYNKELKALLDSGELLKIINQFGFTEQELPGAMTADELSK
jgi:polar amino acid transport system substrate-binding protein